MHILKEQAINNTHIIIVFIRTHVKQVNIKTTEKGKYQHNNNIIDQPIDKQNVMANK